MASDSQVVIASVPTLARGDGARLSRFNPDDFSIVVVDEAHHAVAPSYRRIFDHFGLFAPGGPRYLVGFTATPRRGDKQGLGEIFEEVCYARDLREMMLTYRELADGRRTIIFCVDVAHAQAVHQAFVVAGIRAEAIWGDLPKDERRAVLARFSVGEIHVLTNCNLLTEGFDEPHVDCVIMARPTRSKLLYAQMVGRGTRLHRDKTEAIDRIR